MQLTAVLSPSKPIQFLIYKLFSLIVLLGFSTTSQSAALTLTSQPTNTILSAGTNYSYSLQANSSNPIYYKWFKDGVAISTNKTLQLNSVSTSSAGTYFCRVTDKITTIYCAKFTINVNSKTASSASKLTLAATPKSVNMAEGTNYSYTLPAVGPSNISYKWYKNGVAISSSKTLSINSASITDSGDYSCLVKDSTTTIRCPTFTINVKSVVRIASQPSSQALTEGNGAQLNIEATGSTPISYQWYYKGNKISGATNSSLNIGATKVADSGNYFCRASNPVSSVRSNVAKISISSQMQTGSVRLAWSRPTTRSDGTALNASDIAGYQLFHSATSSSSLTKLASLSGSESSIVVNDLMEGTHYFALATLDSNGMLSTKSSPVSINLSLP